MIVRSSLAFAVRYSSGHSTPLVLFPPCTLPATLRPLYSPPFRPPFPLEELGGLDLNSWRSRVDLVDRLELKA